MSAPPHDAELPECLRRSLESLDRAVDSALPFFIAGDMAEQAPASIDCESRLSLCRAACCRLRFALTEKELDEGILAWDPAQPFLILQNDRGYCTHLEEPSQRCGVYGKRPAPCRNFDCRQDQRIWRSFEDRLLNPAVNLPNWPWHETEE